MEEIGQVPVVVKKEIDGFGLNRIQYAIINEAWNLVKVNQSGTAAADVTAADVQYNKFPATFATCVKLSSSFFKASFKTDMFFY